jgi:plastocyanin domain-containing protein
MKKYIFPIIIVGVLVYGLVALIRWDPQAASRGATDSNVTIVNGTQIIDLTAKGGYQPRTTTAQAGLPTVLKVTTNGTYDCSSIISIPAQDISQTLPASGATDITLGTPAPGIMQGTCGMGMYNFTIDFKS